MNNFTYALGRTLALIAFISPIALQWFPGWQDLTLGFVFHAAITYLNEYVHAPTTN